MSRAKRRVVWIMLLLGGVGWPPLAESGLVLSGLAQSGRRPQGRNGEAEKPVIRIETLEVVLPLLAYDANGRFIDDLKPQEVLVLEEKESRQVVSLKREPANIVLILDGSNEVGTFKNGPTRRYGSEERPVWAKSETASMLANPTAREFAEKFLAALSPRDEVAIIQYADRVQLLQDWTRDSAKATGALHSGYRVGMRSTYYDALQLAATKLAEKPEGRRVVVLLTDGVDSASKSGRTKALRALEHSRAIVFVVGWAEALRREIELAVGWMRGHESFTSASASRLGELKSYLSRLEGTEVELRQLADGSGGIMWLPQSHGEVVRSFRPLAEEIGAQYSLSFATERRPSLEDRRMIEVIPARSGMTLRSRRSYLANEEESRKRITGNR